MRSDETTRPLTSVLTQIVSDIAYLLQTEIRLARAEVNEKLGRAAGGGKLIGAGAVLGLAGLVVLLLAIVAWLGRAGMPEEWALTLVGGIAVFIAAGLATKGTRALMGGALTPQRTLDQLKADIAVAKEQVR